MHNDLKELTRQMNRVTTVVQSLQPDVEDTELQLPGGVNIPMALVDDMETMETAVAKM
jgi:hypothetical protein